MRKRYIFGSTLVRFFLGFLFQTRYYNRHLIPDQGGFLLVSNHISFMDPPLMGLSTSPREINFLAKKELFKYPVFGWLIRSFNAIPVRRGRIDRDLIQRLKALVTKGQALLMFPEGTRSRIGDLLPGKPGVGMLALQAQVPIVPAYLTGTTSLIKALFRRAAISVTFGKPITVPDLQKYPFDKEGYRQLSQDLMERIRQIRDTRNEK